LKFLEFISSIFIRGVIATGIGIILEIAVVVFSALVLPDGVHTLLTSGSPLVSFLIWHAIGWLISWPLVNNLYESDSLAPSYTLNIVDGNRRITANVYEL
jgi:hypothetical protein